MGNELTTILGAGMGSPSRSRMVAKITVPNANNVVDLYGQMAGKEYNGVRFVRFIYGDKTYEQIQPETDLGDTGAISWWGADLDESKLLAKPFVKGRWFLQKGMKKMKLPRAFVLYPTTTTADEYANAWSTFGYPDNFVAGTPGFEQSNSNVLMIPETQSPTNLTVEVALTDVNRDARTVDVTVSAGGVSETVTVTGPTNKKSELLNILTFTLEGVAPGTDEVTITLDSVLGEGDSAALLGAAANYVCEDGDRPGLDSAIGWGDGTQAFTWGAFSRLEARPAVMSDSAHTSIADRWPAFNWAERSDTARPRFDRSSRSADN